MTSSSIWINDAAESLGEGGDFFWEIHLINSGQYIVNVEHLIAPEQRDKSTKQQS